MGNTNNIHLINFESVQEAFQTANVVLINTLPDTMQDCVIWKTVDVKEEVQFINHLIETNQHKETKIIVYGKNCSDISVHEKSKQLIHLGFAKVEIYGGGMFEWLLLQDVYGIDEFPVTKSKFVDLLAFKR
jgi:hypothetical protein